MPYTETVEDDLGDLMTVGKFRKCVECGGFIDYDGFGHPVRNNKADPSIWIKPSRIHEIPASATHIVWYNK